MSDKDRESDSNGGVDRRTILKGTAAAGLAGGALTGTASADEFREITFCAAGDDLFEYEVTVTGEVRRGGTYESDEGDQIIDGNTGRGRVSGGRCDSWLFSGEPTNLELSGPGKVFVDGKLIEDTTADEKKAKLPNTVTIEAKGQQVAYKFRVSGSVEKGPEAGTLGIDTIGGNVVRGEVGGTAGGNPDPVDDYRFSGAIVFDEPAGPLEVTITFDDA